MTYFHIIAGALAILFGFAALVYSKGSQKHRQTGRVFFYTMLVMAATGAVMAYLNTRSLSVVAGMLTLYLVITSWLTVKQKANTVSHYDYLMTAVASVILVLGLIWGFEGLANGGTKDGFPAPMYFVFASVAGIGALFDIKMIYRHGINGKHRIIRHLWRMTFGLWMAVTSFFLGQQQVFPESIRGSWLLVVPVIGVLLTLLFWVVKTMLSKQRQPL